MGKATIAPQDTGQMNQTFLDYFRCPESLGDFAVGGELSADSGYFCFGEETICFGALSQGSLNPQPTDALYNALVDAECAGSPLRLPFDPSQVVENLRHERYVIDSQPGGRRTGTGTLLMNLYYWVRPLMPVAVRRHLQRIYLRNWNKTPFPRWPVDLTVEQIHEKLMALVLKANRLERIPFIWFWPHGAPCCLTMTHDVETSAGRDFCPALMDLNDSFDIKSSFQIVPEKRYDVPARLLEEIRKRGFEVNVHDLNHDGHLYSDRDEFAQRAHKINQYARDFGAQGFRAGVMYRRLEWYDAFEFSYDMSVPNVAHLDPQRGGCCTVMPYFVGQILELPLTTTQDYSLFHVLGDYSIELWKEQIGLIREKHGLISFIVHPDYVIESRARAVYTSLLQHLAALRTEANVWAALPGEVDTWWRQRAAMQLVKEGDRWRIEGPAKERACLAFAQLEDEQIVYRVESGPAKQATGAKGNESG